MRKPLPVILLFIIVTVLMLGCRQSETRRALRQMMGSTIALPENIICVQNGEVFPMPDELRDRPKLFVFIDSLECSLCHVSRLSKYQAVYDISIETESFDLFFLLSIKKSRVNNIAEELVNMELPYPVYIDEDNLFHRMNPFITNDSRFHTFLCVDKTVKLIGDPTVNPDLISLLTHL